MTTAISVLMIIANSQPVTPPEEEEILMGDEDVTWGDEEETFEE